MSIGISAPVKQWVMFDSCNFAKSLKGQLLNKGTLSELQIKRVEEILAGKEKPKPTPERPQIAVDKLFAAFEHAKEWARNNPKKNASTNPKALKLRFKGVSVSPAKENSANPGAIYAYNESGIYIGKIVKGVLYANPQCTPANIEALNAAMSDPLSAAVAYGKEMICCSVCGISLTNPLSRELGIGPICREKFGL